MRLVHSDVTPWHWRQADGIDIREVSLRVAQSRQWPSGSRAERDGWKGTLCWAKRNR
jgi:hypothetical protein